MSSPNYYEDYTDPAFIYLPCGNMAEFDEGSGHSYRCELCGAVVGSIGQPATCKSIQDKYDNWKSLGGKGWDYINGGLKK